MFAIFTPNIILISYLEGLNNHKAR